MNRVGKYVKYYSTNLLLLVLIIIFSGTLTVHAWPAAELVIDNDRIDQSVHQYLLLTSINKLNSEPGF